MQTLLVGETNMGRGNNLAPGLELSRLELADFGARQMGALGAGDAPLPSTFDFSQFGNVAPQPDKQGRKTGKKAVLMMGAVGAGAAGAAIASSEVVFASHPCGQGEIPDPNLSYEIIHPDGSTTQVDICADTAPPPQPTTPRTSPPPTPTTPGGSGGGNPSPTPTTTRHTSPPTTTQPPANVDLDAFPVGPFEADDNSPGIGQPGLDQLKADMAARGLSWDDLDQPVKDIYTIVAISTDPTTFSTRLPAIYNVDPTTTTAEVTTTAEPATTEGTTTSTDAATTTAAETTTSGATTSSATPSSVVTASTNAAPATEQTEASQTSADVTVQADASSSSEQAAVIPPVITEGPNKGGNHPEDSNVLAITLGAITGAVAVGGVILITRRHNRDKDERERPVYDIPSGNVTLPSNVIHRRHSHRR